jgi:hypothetical protein
MFTTALLHLHSSFRYVVLALIIGAIVNAIIGITSKKSYTSTSKRLALFALIFSHLQLLGGLILYLIGPRGLNTLLNMEGVMSDSMARFFAVEHISMMIIAIALITIGYVKAKNKAADRAKFMTILSFYGIALVIIFIMIPWPFLKEFGRWM